MTNKVNHLVTPNLKFILLINIKTISYPKINKLTPTKPKINYSLETIPLNKNNNL